MLETFWNWISEEPATRIPVAVALIGVGGAVLGGFLVSVVWPLLRTGMGKSWDSVLGFFSGRRYENRYLDWVIDQHRFLPILPTTLVPVTQKQPQELDKLYVALTVAGPNDEEQAITIGESLTNNPRIVVLGDPGAGKTTMLRFLALTFARARRGRPGSLMGAEDRKDERKRVRAAQRHLKSHFALDGRYRLPVFLYLNRLKDAIKENSGQGLMSILANEIRKAEGLGQLPPGFFAKRLRRGQCLFLFDAFDELGDPEARAAVAHQIANLAAAAPKGNLFIVTSRIVGYSGQLSNHGFHSITIQRLSWELISELVTKWYSTLGEPALTETLLETLRENPRISDLAVNPMLLSLVALVQYVRRLIPDKRHVLYEDCIKILVERRYAHPNVQMSYNRTVGGEEAVQILREIAREFHLHNLREMPRSQIEDEAITRVLHRLGLKEFLAATNEEILRNLEERSQLLVERGLNDQGQPMMAFSHLTFQEYLTSVAYKEEIAKEGEEKMTSDLLEKYKDNPEWWEEVALLYAAQLDAQFREAFLMRVYPPSASSVV